MKYYRLTRYRLKREDLSNPSKVKDAIKHINLEEDRGKRRSATVPLVVALLGEIGAYAGYGFMFKTDMDRQKDRPNPDDYDEYDDNGNWSNWNGDKYGEDVNKHIENFGESDTESISRAAGVDIINDPRFVEFLKENQGIPKLKYLIDVPHLSLDNWNYPKEKKHPLYLRCKENTGHELKSDHFSIPAIHFPRWFYSRKEKLFKPLEEWESLWKQKTGDTKLHYFAPPRDPYNNTHRTFKDNNQLKDIYDTLVQIPILLICKNGHISDIPWYELFCAGIDGKKEAMKNPAGFELFDYPCQECERGGRHELQWIENRNNSESWGTLKCKKCGKTYGLEGIMNIHPFCKGDTPWNGIGSKSE